MKPNPSNRNDHLRRLSDSERQTLLEQLQEKLDWIDEYELKEPLLRTDSDKELYKKKSSESGTISRQLSQHALMLRNQLAYLLTDTMEMLEIAMDIDPSDDEKYEAYHELKRVYVKFMRAFKRDFRNN